MISARVKDLLTNLLIVSLLITFVLLLGLLFKDRIVGYFSERSKGPRMVFNGPQYEAGSSSGFHGVVVEVDAEKIIIEKDGKREEVFVDGAAKVAVFESETISESLKQDKEERKISAQPVPLQGKAITAFIKERDVVTVAKFRKEGANYFAEEILVFGERKEVLFE